MPLPRKFNTIYMSRPWNFRQQSNNHIVAGNLDAGIRVRIFLYQQAAVLAGLGFRGTPPSSGDNPPRIATLLIYKNDKAAARNGWVGELGFVLERFSAPQEEKVDEEGNPVPNPVISREKSSVYYTFDKQVATIATMLYGTVWADPIIPGGTYKIKPGSIHQIKHRNTTPYF